MADPLRVTVLGASGGVGRHVVRHALDQGWDVTALVRDARKLGLAHERLRVVEGDACDGVAIARAVAGADVVISALGQAKGSPRDLLTVSGGHLVAAMQEQGVKRLVTLVGAGVSLPDDGPPSLGRRFMWLLMGLLAKHVLEDAQKHAEIVRDSGLDVTLVRPPRLTDDPATGRWTAEPYMHLGPSAKMSRDDLGKFMVEVARDGAFVGQAPMVANA